MDKAKLLLIFTAVIRAGAMSRAAPALGMTASAISQHIRRLEALYGLKLLNRNTRRLELTEAGQVLWQQAERLSQLMQDTDAALADLRQLPQGDVRISLPTGFIATAAIRRLLTLCGERYPAIRLTLMAEDRLADLQHNSADIAIRVGELSDSLDNVARRLATCRMHICAAPAYLAAHPLNNPADLYGAHWLNHSDAILLAALAALGLPPQLPENRTECPASAVSAYYLALAGMGLTLALSLDVAPLLADGGLCIVLPQHRLPEKSIYAVSANAAQSAKNRAVLGLLHEVFKEVAAVRK